MDAATAQMMADLGLARRDLVSAPEDIQPARTDPRARAAVAAEVSSRRRQAAAGGSGNQDDSTARLRAWNMETTFDKDEVASQLIDRFSGQGHRAELRRRIGNQSDQDDHMDTVRARFGEERTAYLREHNRIPRGATFQSLLSSHGRADRQDRSSNNSNSTRSRQAPAPRGSNRDRAPSPRRAGTIRFRPNGSRTVLTPGVERAISMPSLGTTAAARIRQMAATVQSNAGTAASAGSSMSPPASMLSSIHAVPSAVMTNVASLSSTNGQGSVRPAAKGVSAGEHDLTQQQMYHNRALWHAANPGEECDKYHLTNPDCLQYLGPARDQLIKEALKLAFDGSDKATKAYVEAHKERAWMVEAAVKAKHQIEEQSEEEVKAYCDKHPRQKVFLNAAKHVFKPKPSQLPERKKVDDATAPAVNSTRQPIEDEVPRRSSPSSFSSATSEASTDSASSISDTLVSAAGSLAVTFYDIAGQLLGNCQIPLNVPAFATLNVMSKARRFDPRDLINSIETLAKNMQEAATITPTVQGAKLADDGLWEEDEEL